LPSESEDVVATSVLIPIAEYLETSYRPDREYMDGEVLERHIGSWGHGRVQMLLAGWFVQHEVAWGVIGATEWRTRVADSRVRIPDVVLVNEGPQTRVLDTPPVLIVEILSPEDTYVETERRAADYQRMGVETIWMIDPETRTGRVCVGRTWTQATCLEVPGTPIYVELESLFSRLG
jgi:Uma2 family endonuclease